jgi:hypothetical protein
LIDFFNCDLVFADKADDSLFFSEAKNIVSWKCLEARSLRCKDFYSKFNIYNS